MAKVVNLSSYRYQRLEALDNSAPLPVELGARLQLGFNLDNAMHSTANMKIYPQFHSIRRVQYIRQVMFVEVMKYRNPLDKKRLLALIANIASIAKKIYKSQEELEMAIESLSAMKWVSDIL